MRANLVPHDHRAGGAGHHARLAGGAALGVEPDDHGGPLQEERFGGADAHARAAVHAALVGAEHVLLERLQGDPLLRQVGNPPLVVGLGLAIPILDEEMAERTAVSDDQITAPIVDYSESYPQCVPGNLGEASYAALKSGRIAVDGKDLPAVPLSSYPMAVEIAGLLKQWVAAGRFLVAAPVDPIPGPESGRTFKPLVECPVEVK